MFSLLSKGILAGLPYATWKGLNFVEALVLLLQCKIASGSISSQRDMLRDLERHIDLRIVFRNPIASVSLGVIAPGTYFLDC